MAPARTNIAVVKTRKRADEQNLKKLYTSILLGF